MNIQVSGRLTLSNGQSPFIWSESSGYIPFPNKQKAYTCKLLGESILIEFPDGIPYESPDEIFRYARHIIDGTILIQVLQEGIGIQYSLNFCKVPDGTVHQATPDHSPSGDIDQVDNKKLYTLLGVNQDMRWALRDFNQGLLDRENCPVLFYKAIESSARAVLKLKPEAEVDKKEWNAFHIKIGTRREDMQILYTINESHRHGNHIFFTREQHLEMMASTKLFLQKAASYLTTLSD